MSMFITVIDHSSENFHEVEKTLVEHFGYNDCYWRRENNTIKVYYKDIPVIQHLI